MLQTQTANLPPDEQRRLHPDFLANEQAYLQMRDSLVAHSRGQWVAVQGGRVIAAGPALMEVMDLAETSGGHPYVALVGEEDAVVFRVRRAVFAYDRAYQPFSLSRLTATFLNHAETHSQQHPNVIPDTGADASVLPDSDCVAIRNWPDTALAIVTASPGHQRKCVGFVRGSESASRHVSSDARSRP